MGPGGHLDPEISEEGPGVGGGGGWALIAGLQKIFFGVFGPQFGLKIRGDGHQDPSPESTTDLNVVG